MMTIALELALILGLILTNGLLAMAEMAIVSAKKNRLKKAMDDGDHGAAVAIKLAESHTDFLASIQVGITLIGVLAGVFSGARVSGFIAKQVASVSPMLTDYAEPIGLAIVVLVVTYFSLVLGELVPKRMALHSPERIAIRMARPIAALGRGLKPVVYVLSRSTNMILRLFHIHNVNASTVTEEEVRFMIEEGTESGVFDKQEETLIKRVLRFDDLNITDVMTPRTQVVAFDVHDPVETVLTRIAECRHSYFPVFDTHMDRPLGHVSSKTLMAMMIRKEPIDLRACIDDALYLPETLAADDALEKFRETKKHIAFVVDEYGGFAGLITVNDLITSIVGDIPSHNQQSAQSIIQRDDGSWLVDAQIPYEELFDVLGLEETGDEDYQTVAGFVMAKLAKIPEEGEKVAIADFVFEVVDMDRRRIDKILVYSKKTPE